MTRRHQYLTSVAAVAVPWSILSIFLMLVIAGAEDDAGVSLEQQAALAHLTKYLKVALDVACPALHLLPQHGFQGLSDHAFGAVIFSVVAANSLAWAFALVSLQWLAARLFVRRNREATRAA